jgi:hypothetical protein
MEALRAWLYDVADWSCAVVKHWVPLVTGGLVTAILLVVNLKSGQTPTWLTWIWLYVAILCASFLAWREGSRGRPRFRAYIKRVSFFVGAAGDGAWIVGRVFFSNWGTPSTIHDLEIWANRGGNAIRGEISNIERRFILTDPTDPTISPLHIWPEQSLQHTNRQQFEKGQGHDYQFLALFRGQETASFPASSVHIRFKDAFDRPWVTIDAPRQVDERALVISSNAG